MAIVGASVAIEQVHALVVDQPAVSSRSTTTVDSSAQVQALADAIKKAAASAQAGMPADADAAARREAIANVVQEVIITAGASPATVLSAIYAVRNCSSGLPNSTAGMTLRPGLVSVDCSGDKTAGVDDDTLAALASIEGVVVALLDGEQPAALGGGFFGGLNVPPSAGLFAGGTDYIS